MKENETERHADVTKHAAVSRSVSINSHTCINMPGLFKLVLRNQKMIPRDRRSTL